MEDGDSRALLRWCSDLQEYEAHPSHERQFDMSAMQSSGFNLCIGMQYCNGGTLRRAQTICSSLKDEHIRHWLRQIAIGLDALHQQQIVHRDIKPDNLFIHNEGILNERLNIRYINPVVSDQETVMIGDFGLIKELSSQLAQTRVGSLQYLSPEIMFGSGHGTETDCYSLGIALFEMLLHVDWANGPSTEELPHETMARFRRDLHQNETNSMARLEIWKMLMKTHDRQLATLVFELININPEERPTCAEVVAFLDDSNKHFVRNDPQGNNENENRLFAPSLRPLHTISSPSNSPRTISATSAAEILFENLDSELAHKFWRKNFGINRIDVSWRPFNGAYQLWFGRLSVIQARGLKKLLCGPDMSATIYYYVDAVDLFGFPFDTNFLEKIEKYFVESSLDAAPGITFITRAHIKDAERKYLTMIVEHDRWFRDAVSGVRIDIDKESVPLQVVTQKERNFSAAEEATTGEEQDPLASNSNSRSSLSSSFEDEYIDEYIDIDRISMIQHTNDQCSASPAIDNTADYIMNLLTQDSASSSGHLRLFINGPVSSGKTILLRTTLYRMAKHALQYIDSIDCTSDTVLIPILVNIANLTMIINQKLTFEHKLIRASPHHSFQYSADIETFLRESITQKRALLLFDGLDEAHSGSSLSWTTRIIQELALSNYNIIVTSRITPRKGMIGFHEVRLVPLSASLRRSLAVKRGITDPQFLDKICDPDNGYEEITRVPLMLSLLIEMYKSEKHLPSNRAELYSIAVDNMIKMYLKRHCHALNRISEELERIFIYLRDLSHHFHMLRKVFFSLEEIQEWEASSSMAKESGIRFEHDIAELVHQGQFPLLSSFKVFQSDWFKFSSLSFQEFLCSCAWRQAIESELNDIQKMPRSRTGSLTLFGAPRSPRPKIDYFNVYLKPVLDDIYFKEAFRFLASSLEKNHFKELVKSLQAMVHSKRRMSISMTAYSIIASMLGERNREETISQQQRKLFQQIADDKQQHMRIVDGLLHHSHTINAIALRIHQLFGYDSDSTLKSILRHLKSNKRLLNGHAIAQTIRTLLEYHQQQQQMAHKLSLSSPNSNPPSISLDTVCRDLFSIVQSHFHKTKSSSLPSKRNRPNSTTALYPTRIFQRSLNINLLVVLQVLKDLVPKDSRLREQISIFISQNCMVHSMSVMIVLESALLVLYYAESPSSIANHHIKLPFVRSILRAVFYRETNDFVHDDRRDISRLRDIITRKLHPFIDKDKEEELIREALDECNVEHSFSKAGLAIALLVTRSNKYVLHTLQSMLALSESKYVKMKVLEALKSLQSEGPSDIKITQHVLQLFVDCSWPVRVLAARFLQSTTSDRCNALGMDFIMDRLSGAKNDRKLVKYKARAVRLLSTFAMHCKDDERVRYAKSLLRTCMDDDKFDVRVEAVQGVVRCSDAEEKRSLHEQLLDKLAYDDNTFVKQIIISQLPALGIITRREWRQEIVDMLMSHVVQRDRDLDLACECVSALGLFAETSHASNMDVLFSLLAGDELHVKFRKKAAETIAAITTQFIPSQTPAMVSRLIPLLRPDFENRYHYYIHDQEENALMNDSQEAMPSSSSLSLSTYTHTTLSDNEIIFDAIYAMIMPHQFALTQEHVLALYQRQCLEAEFLVLSSRH